MVWLDGPPITPSYFFSSWLCLQRDDNTTIYLLYVSWSQVNTDEILAGIPNIKDYRIWSTQGIRKFEPKTPHRPYSFLLRCRWELSWITENLSTTKNSLQGFSLSSFGAGAGCLPAGSLHSVCFFIGFLRSTNAVIQNTVFSIFTTLLRYVAFISMCAAHDIPNWMLLYLVVKRGFRIVFCVPVENGWLFVLVCIVFLGQEWDDATGWGATRRW